MLGVKKSQLALAVIVLLGCVRIYLAEYLPILGDGGAHAYLVRTIIETGLLPPHSAYPLLFHSYFDYPALFHLDSALVGLFVGPHYKLLPAIAGVATVVVVYLLTKGMLGSERVALLSALLVSVDPGHILYSSVFYIESVLILFIFLTMWCHIKFMKTKHKSWLVLTGVFLGAAVATKQIGYIMFAIVPIQHLVLTVDWKRIRIIQNLKSNLGSLASMLVASALVFGPFLMHFYVNTGTIFQPSNPLANFLFFKSEVVPDPAAARYIFEGGLFGYGQFDPLATLSNVLNPFFLAKYSLPMYWLFVASSVVLAVFGVLNVWRWRSRVVLYLMVFSIAYLLLLLLLQSTKYFIHLKMVVAVFVASSLLLTRYRIGGRMRLALLVVGSVLVLLLAGALYVNGIKKTEDKLHSMCWLHSEAPVTNLIEAYEYVEDHTSPGDVIADPSYTEGTYYMDRESFWLSTAGGVDFYAAIRDHDNALVEQAFVKYNIHYLVIIDNLVTEGEPNTEQFIRYQDYDFIKGSPLFELAFDKPGVQVYKYVGT